MKRLLLILCAAVLAVCCTTRTSEPAAGHSDWTYDSVVYEMNVRQLTPEGTFAAAAKELPMLKSIGVDIVWLMPIHPIGVLERKGSLGSYYAPRNYREINPEFGTLEDFDAFLAEVHRLGMKLIIDWVANHTSPDSEWAGAHPEWFRRNEDGSFVVQYDWTDIAPLDLTNEEMQAEIRDCMRFWLDRGVDGFRCDVAGEMPVDEYWKKVLLPVRGEYTDKYFLAEGEKPELHSAGFDATYAWELHHLLNDVAQGKAGAAEIAEYVEKDLAAYPADALRLSFTSNHDENSWAGTEFERMGDAWKAMTVLCWTLPGAQPLIYTGQEVGLHHRFAFFEKDPLPSHAWNAYTDFYSELAKLRHTNPDLLSGGPGGEYELLGTEDNTLRFRRGGTIVSVQCEAPWAYSVSTPSDRVARVEPPCWWTGMSTPLQILVNGEQIGSYDVAIKGGKGVKVSAVHTADSPNYLFVDVKIAANATPGTYDIVFSRDGESFSVPYEIGARSTAPRSSFSTEDAIYLIMPDRFVNGDPGNDGTPDTAEKPDYEAFFGRHGGDLAGIRSQLDYISGLGMTAVWCTPLLLDNEPWESYHGYACADYYHVDPRFGGNMAFRQYADDAHAHGLKLIMDVVTNHCGSAHWWMADLPFADWVHQWPEYTHSNCSFSAQNDPYCSDFDRENMLGGWFAPSMPDMNLDNPYVLQYFKQWACWWIEWAGIDGLRVDTFPYNEKQPISEWCRAVREEYPWINIVGEVWSTNVPQVAYWQAGNPNPDGYDSKLPSIMDFCLHNAICQGINTDREHWDEGLTRIYDSVANDFYIKDTDNMMIFPGNHDTDRIADIIGRDPGRWKEVMALMATMRGFPQFFAGDELMAVSRDRREGHGGLRVEFPLNWEQDAAMKECHDWFSALMQWRKGSEAVQHGGFKHFIGRDNTYAYFRTGRDHSVFVFLNNNPEPVRVPWEHYAEVADSLPDMARDVVSGAAVNPADCVVDGRSAIVMEF